MAQSDQTDLPPPPSSDSQRFIPTPFLTKTYQLVNDASINTIVSWNEDGTGFIVWSPAEFALHILPKYFKHNNFSSFVRQLNTYGFRKVMPDRWEFFNDCFRRGDKRLLCDIVRRKLTVSATTSAVSNLGSSSSAVMEPSTSNSGERVFSTNAAALFIEHGNCNSNIIIHGSRANLTEENDRLKKENTQLSKELKQMKSMCTNIYSMMSNYNTGSGQRHGPGRPNQGQVVCGSSNSSQAESIINPLNLLANQRLLATVVETQAVEACPVISAGVEDTVMNSRLFGFQLGSKRARGKEDREGDHMKHGDYLQLQQPGSRH